MKILQVWNNINQDNRFFSCMKKINSLCKDNGAPHIIVCKNPDLFQDFENVTLINFDQFMDGKDVTWWGPLLQNYRSQSDFVRMFYAQTDPDIFYIDADVELFYIPEFKSDGKPYFGSYTNHLDFYMLYVNGNCQFFDTLMKQVQKFPNTSWMCFMRLFFTLYSKGSSNYNLVNIFPKECSKRNWFN